MTTLARDDVVEMLAKLKADITAGIKGETHELQRAITGLTAEMVNCKERLTALEIICGLRPRASPCFGGGSNYGIMTPAIPQ